MSREGTRIDGWKAIAAFLGRDRSTVMRWASERGLPVHSLPGGKARTVYAFADELDAWRAGRLTAPGQPSEPLERTEPTALTQPIDPPVEEARETQDIGSPAPRRRGARRALLVLAPAMLCGAAALTIHYGFASTPTRRALSPPEMARFLQARDDIAARSSDRLRAALVALRAIEAREPAHLGTHEALAEAYLLAREFGSVPDVVAFARAREEAVAARRLDPGSATADRVDGVVAYWNDRDPQRAGRLFRRAIDHAPQDALAHHWYANILADNGEDAAAAREFTAARLLSPAASYLLADYAWGLWSAGRSQEAEAELRALAVDHPELASVYDCLSVIALAAGDLRGYADNLRRRAVARGEAELTAYSVALEQALRSGSNAAAYAVIASRANAYADAAERSDHSWAAFVVSVAGDQAQLRSILRHARERGEHWGSAGFVRRIAARWPADLEVQASLRALRQAAIE